MTESFLDITTVNSTMTLSEHLAKKNQQNVRNSLRCLVKVVNEMFQNLSPLYTRSIASQTKRNWLWNTNTFPHKPQFVKVAYTWLLMETPLHSYQWDVACHTGSHCFTCHPRPALITARQAGTWFAYPGGMEGWADL